MSYAVGKHFDKFIREQVQAGRYNNASEVVREGLRLVEERRGQAEDILTLQLNAAAVIVMTI